MKLITLTTAFVFLPIVTSPIVTSETRAGDKFYPDWAAVKKLEPASSQSESTPAQASEQQKTGREQPRSDADTQKQLKEGPREEAGTNVKAEPGGVKEPGSRQAETSKSTNDLKVIGTISGSVEIGAATSPISRDAGIPASGAAQANKGIPIHIKGELYVTPAQLLQILTKTDQNRQVDAVILGPQCKDLIKECVNEQIEGRGQNGEKCQSYRQECQKG